jgi:hypothetical protein
MIADFRILALKDGKYMVFTGDDIIPGVAVGEFWFSIDGKDVHFDFDGYCLSEGENGVFSYMSCCGVDDYYDEDLASIGLSTQSLTAPFLASVSEIKDFHVNFLIESDEEEEIDIGDFEENVRADIPYKIELLNISFQDFDLGEEFSVKEDVLKKFNGK